MGSGYRFLATSTLLHSLCWMHKFAFKITVHVHSVHRPVFKTTHISGNGSVSISGKKMGIHQLKSR